MSEPGAHGIQLSARGIFKNPLTRTHRLSVAGNAIGVNFVILVLEVCSKRKVLNAAGVFHTDPVTFFGKKASKAKVVATGGFHAKANLHPFCMFYDPCSVGFISLGLVRKLSVFGLCPFHQKAAVECFFGNVR